MDSMHAVKARELLGYLESIIRQHGARYADKKREISANVGFENVAVEGHISFQKGVTMDEIVDVQIGLKDATDVADFAARSVRFGIPARTPFVSGVPGRVSMRSHPKKCVVQVSSERCAREISLPSDFYAPSIPGIPKEKLRFRIANPFIQLILRAADDNLSFISRWEDSAQKKLEDLAAVLDLVHIFGSGKVRIRLNVDGIPLGGGVGETEKFEITPAIEAIDAFVTFLRKQTMRHEVPSDFQLSLRDLLTRAYEIAEHNALVMQPSVDGSCVIEWITEPYTRPATLLYSVLVQLPRHVVYTIVRRKLEVQPKNEGGASLLWREFDYTRVRILPGSVASTKNIVVEEVSATAQEISEHVVVTIHEPFQAGREAQPDPVDSA